MIYERATPSPWGFHSWTSFGRCPRQATLNLLALRQPPSGPERPGAKGVGTALHAMLDLYYRGVSFNPTELVLRPALDELDIIEAARVFSQYSAIFSPDELGQVLGTEVHIGPPGDGSDDDELGTTGPLATAIGVWPFAARIDMVVNITDAAAVQARRGIDVEPGIYLVDHKSHGAAWGTLVDKHLNSLQFVAYQLAWNATHPDRPCLGMIANVIIKTKSIKTMTLLQRSPSPSEIAALRGLLQGCAAQRRERPGWANPQEEFCFSQWGVCQWFANDVCDRSEITAPQLGEEGI